MTLTEYLRHDLFGGNWSQRAAPRPGPGRSWSCRISRRTSRDRDQATAKIRYRMAISGFGVTIA